MFGLGVRLGGSGIDRGWDSSPGHALVYPYPLRSHQSRHVSVLGAVCTAGDYLEIRLPFLWSTSIATWDATCLLLFFTVARARFLDAISSRCLRCAGVTLEEEP